MGISHDSFAQKSKIFQISNSGSITYTEELKDRPVSALVPGNGSWYFLSVNKVLHRVSVDGKVVSTKALTENLSGWVNPWIAPDGSVWIGMKDSNSIYIERFDPTLQNRTLFLTSNAYSVYEPLGVSPQGELVVPVRKSYVSDEFWAWVDSNGNVQRETKLPCLAKSPVLDFTNERAFFICDLVAKVVLMDMRNGEVLESFQTDRSFSSWTPSLSFNSFTNTISVAGRWSDGQIYILDSRLRLKHKQKFGDGMQSFQETGNGTYWSWVYDYSSNGLVARLLELDSSFHVTSEMTFTGGQLSDLGVSWVGEQWFIYSSSTKNELCRAKPGATAAECVGVALGLNGDASSRTDLGSGRTRFSFWNGNSQSAMIYEVQ